MQAWVWQNKQKQRKTCLYTYSSTLRVNCLLFVLTSWLFIWDWFSSVLNWIFGEKQEEFSLLFIFPVTSVLLSGEWIEDGVAGLRFFIVWIDGPSRLVLDVEETDAVVSASFLDAFAALWFLFEREIDIDKINLVLC